MKHQPHIQRAARIIIRVLAVIVLTAGVALSAAAAITAQAAAFRNLDFEQANTNNLQFSASPSGVGDPTDLLPGWTLYHGTEVQTSMFFNGACDCGSAALVNVGVPPAPIQGTYSLYIETARQVPFSIVQQGDIPPDAAFLRYEYSQFPFSLSINGEPVQYLFGFSVLKPQPPPGTRPVLFDISKFAGQNVELSLTTDLPFMGYGINFLDNIQFLPRPRLEVRHQNGVLLFSWPANWPSADFNPVLQSTAGLSASNQWRKVDVPFVQAGVNMTATQAVAGASGFFRLYQTTK